MIGRVFCVVAVLAISLTLSKTSVADSGADTYKARCTTCHGATGAGDTAMGKNLKLRDLATPEVQQQSDADLSTIITKGKAKMPAYEGKLSKEQIDELVKHIRTLKK